MAIVKLRDITEFEWDEANIAHIDKHNVIRKKIAVSNIYREWE